MKEMLPMLGGSSAAPTLKGLPDPPSSPNVLKQIFTTFAMVVLPLVIGIALSKYVVGPTPEEIKKVLDDLPYLKNLTGLSLVYMSAVIFGRVVTLLNVFPTIFYKNKLFGKDVPKDMRANSTIYRIAESSTAVVMAEEGDAGALNRANRSLTHFVENSLPFVMQFFLLAFIAPKTVFYCVCAFGLGRVLHQVGYTTGYGGHAPGFLITSFASNTLEGMCFVVAMQIGKW